MTNVIDTVPLGLARPQRKSRLRAVQRLDGGLFVYAEYRGMARWIQIQPQNVLGLSLKIRVRTGHISSDSMWLQPRFVPDPHHRHMTHPDSAGHPSGRPMS